MNIYSVRIENFGKLTSGEQPRQLDVAANSPEIALRKVRKSKKHGLKNGERITEVQMNCMVDIL